MIGSRSCSSPEYLQEIDTEGDTRSKLRQAWRLSHPLPVMQGDGTGIERAALKLKKARVKGLDVAPGQRVLTVSPQGQIDRRLQAANIGTDFWIGFPTPVSVVLANVGLPISDGAEDGLDAAEQYHRSKFVAWQDGCCGALEGREALEVEVTTIIDELKAAMFLVAQRM